MLRVLKDIGAVESLPLLEAMITWPDDRMRLEIIKTLEGMPPEAAIKILVKLVNYGPYEIRRSAIISMGLSANAVSIPYLRDIIFEFPDSRQAAIAALARIGNSEARDILIKIFEDEGLYMAHRVEKKDIEEIRLLILRALAEISDETAIRKIEEYSQKTFSKSLFKKDILSNTAKIILTGKKR
jgi:HEAT repeat protein